MPRLNENDVVHFRAMGNAVRITAVFSSATETNAYLTQHPEEGVIAEAGGLIWIANVNDKRVVF